MLCLLELVVIFPYIFIFSCSYVYADNMGAVFSPVYLFCLICVMCSVCLVLTSTYCITFTTTCFIQAIFIVLVYMFFFTGFSSMLSTLKVDFTSVAFITHLLKCLDHFSLLLLFCIIVKGLHLFSFLF